MDLPESSMEESCKIDMEPQLEAGIPSLDVEGMQGSADLGKEDISLRKPEFDASGPEVHMSGPNVNPNVDLQGSSYKLNLPSAKTKRGKCFSCASSGDKDEPYSKGKTNTGLDLERPDVGGSIDMNTDGTFSVDSGARGAGISIPATSAGGKIEGPSADREEIDLRHKTQLDTNAPDMETTQGKLRTPLSEPDVDVSPGKCRGPETKVNVPPTNLDLPTKKGKRGKCFSCAGGSGKEEPYKKRRGNAEFDLDSPGSVEMETGRKFDISRSNVNLGANIERPVDEIELHSSAPDVDLSGNSQERNVDITGPNVSFPSPRTDINVPERSLDGENIDVDTHEPNLNISMKKPNVGIDEDDAKIKTPEVKAPEVSKSKLNNEIRYETPSLQKDLPSKKKGGKCLPCTGTKEKDEPYRRGRGNADFDFSGPEFDGSENISAKRPKLGIEANTPDIDGLEEMKKPGTMDISAPGPDFDGHGENKDLGLRTTGPDFDIQGPNKGISTGTPNISVHTRDPNIKAPDISMPSGSTNVGFSEAEDISLKRPKVGIDVNNPDINGPEGRISTEISGADTDISTGKLRGPRTQVDAPSGELNLPSTKKKRGNCLSCAGDGDKDDPYRKTKGNLGYDFSGPDGSLEMKKPGKIDLSASGPDFDGRGETKDLGLRTTGPDFDIQGPNKGISTGTPNISVHTRDPNIKAPDISMPSGSTNVGFSGAEDISLKRPKVGIDVNNPDIDGPEGRISTEISGADTDISTDKLRGPRTQVDAPSGELNLPSTKKKRGNCLSCAGDGDKDDPYRKTKGNLGYDFSGPDGSLEMKKPGKIDLSASGPDFDGRGKTKELDLSTTGPDFDIQGPNKEITARTPDISVHTRNPDIKTLDASIPSGRTNMGFSGPSIAEDALSAAAPNIEGDVAIPRPSASLPSVSGDGVTSGRNIDIDTSGPGFDISGKKPSVGLETNIADFNTKKGELQPEMSTPGIDVSTGNIKGPKANVYGPSSDVHIPSGKKPRGKCFSCTGNADKDEPYRKAKGDTDFGLNEFDGSLSVTKPSISQPNFDIDGIPTGSDFDIGTPDIDVSAEQSKIGLKSPEFEVPRFGGSGETGNDVPKVSYETPKISGSSVGKMDDAIEIHGADFDINAPDIEKHDNGFKTPGFDLPSERSARELDLSGPDFSYEKPKLSGPSIGRIDKSIGSDGPDLDIEAPQGEVDIDAPKVSYETPNLSEPSFGKTDGDIDFQRADKPSTGFTGLDVPKPGGREIDINGPDISMPSMDEITGPSKPGADLDDDSNLDIPRGKPSFGFDADRRDLNIPDMETNLDMGPPRLSKPSVENREISVPLFPSKDVNFDVSTLDADITTSNPTIGDLDNTGDVSGHAMDFPSRQKLEVDMKGLDVDIPDSGFGFPSMDKKGESFEPLDIKASRGKDFDANFDSGISTSTPKDSGKIKFEANPVEGDIPMVNTYDNLELHSTPFPSVAYEEPRSLQRYDEIRPEMQLRLLSPNQTDKSEQSFNVDIPDASLKKAGSMTLVKVEENVTVCLASVEEPSSSSRTVTLDREIKQQIEVVFPEEEGSDQPSMLKHKSSSSSSSSSSSDAESDKEKKPQRKKKSRLFKAFRKSSSSSDDDDKDKNPPSKHVLPISTIREKKEKTSSSSSSSDEGPSDVKQQDLPKRKSSKGSSSDKENDSDKKEVLYKVEHTRFPIVDGEIKEPEEPGPIFYKVEKDVPVKLSTSVRPVDPALSPQDEIKPKERKLSTTSSSDEESESTMVHKLTYTTYQPRYIMEPTTEQDQPLLSVADVHQNTSEVVLHSIKPIDPDFSSTLDDKTPPKEKKSLRSSSSSSDEEISSYNIKELDDLEKTKDQAAPEQKSSESSSSSEEEKDKDNLTPGLDLSLHRYETVHHVITHDYPSKEQETNPSGVQEHPFVIVSRSLKRHSRDISSTATEDTDGPDVTVSSTEVQFNEPSREVTYHLDYPCKLAEFEEDDGAHIQEEGVVPVFKSPSVDYDVPDVSALLEPPEEDEVRDLLPSDKDRRTSPTWDIQAHTFENVYHVTIPDYPTIDGDSLEIQEQSPTVVTRSLKRASPVTTNADDDLEAEPRYFTNTMEVQFTEPENDFQLGYPENYKVFPTDEQNANLTEEEWILQHTKERETPDISARLAAWDHAIEEAQLRNDSQTKAEDQDKSPREKSPKEITRRGSNSRLWDLMQGYLIEQPIMNDDETYSESTPEKTGEQNKEGEQVVYETKSTNIVESSVFEETQQSPRLITYQIHIDDKEPSKEVVNTTTKVESSVSEVTIEPKDAKFDPVSFQVDGGDERPKDYTASIPKVESSISYVSWTPEATEFKPVSLDVDAADEQPVAKEYRTAITKVESGVPDVSVAPQASKFESISLQVDVGAIQPVSKEYHTPSWKKQIAVPADVDDKDDDPWMRHYSKGLHQGASYQPHYTKSPERESSFDERRGLSLSKVPHVKGIKTSGEKERERPRYSIESRTRTEPTPYRISAERKSMLRDLEAVPRVRTHESLFSTDDDKEQSKKSQTRTARGDSSRETSTAGPSVQSLRSFWDK